MYDEKELLTNEEITDSRIPDIASVEFLRPEATQRFAMKLRFENGETRKFCFLRGSSELEEVVRFKSYAFTDEIFANGRLTCSSCGQGVEFTNGFFISKTQLYQESELFYEPEILNEVVFENQNYRIIKIFEWHGSKLNFDKEANLYKVLLPGAYSFNYRGSATYALTNGQRATNLDFSYMDSFQDGLALVCIAGYGCGFVDKNMDFAIPPRYESANDFFDGFARVAVLENNEYRWFFIDKNGKELVFMNLDREAPREKYKILCDFSEGMARVSIMQQPELAYVSDYEDYAGVWGYIDSAGLEIVPPQYIYAMDLEEGLAEVCKGKWTKDEKWNHKYKTGAFWTEEELWGFIDGMGREVVPCIFDEVKRFWREGSEYFGAHYGGWKEGKWGIIDRTGKWVVEPIFGYIGYDISKEGCFTFSDGDRFEELPLGIYSIPGKRALFEPQFEDVDYMDNGLFSVKLFDPELGRNVTKILDKTGKTIFPSEYTLISERGDYYEVTIREEGTPDRNGIINQDGCVAVPCQYSIPTTGGVCAEKRLFIFEEGGKQGIKSFTEETVIPAIYDDLRGLGSDFLTARLGCKENYLEGLLLPDGTQVLPTGFKSISVDNDRITAQHETGTSGFLIIRK